MALSTDLAAAPGHYSGTGNGAESGEFIAHFSVSLLPNGGALVLYEAVSRQDELLHHEHTLLTPGPDGRDHLYVAHSESPFVTEMVESAAGSGRFVQPQPFGPYDMEIHIEMPEPDRLVYAWWWEETGKPPIEQSRADARRHPSA